MKRHTLVRDAEPLALTAQAAQLPALLHHQRPTLGVFSLAGFPDERSGIDALISYARRGASVLEVGAPTSNPWLDGPDIAAAHRQALLRGHGMDTVLTTVRQVVAATRRPVIVMSYWASVLAYGPQRLANALAAAGGAGCMVPDLPTEHAGTWLAATVDAGIHAPLLASREAPAEFSAACRAATGFVYAPAVAGPTGYRGNLDPAALAAFVASIRRAAPATPVVTGIGVSTPELASAIVRQADVSAVMVGSPLIRALLSGGNGLSRAAELVEEFAAAVTVPQLGR